MSIIIRKSTDIAQDLTRNYSTYAMTRMEASSEEEYLDLVFEALAAKGLAHEEVDPFDGTVTRYGTDCEVVDMSDGSFALKHHDWLAGTEIEIEREEFEALSDEAKAELCAMNAWGEGFFVEDGQEYPSFDADDATMIWSNGVYHVFETDYTQTQTAPPYSFIDAFPG